MAASLLVLVVTVVPMSAVLAGEPLLAVAWEKGHH
jgi:hypothetical protein